jgi:hypothetical protein
MNYANSWGYGITAPQRTKKQITFNLPPLDVSIHNDEIVEQSIMCGGVESSKLNDIKRIENAAQLFEPEREDDVLDITPKALDTTPNDSIKVIRKDKKIYKLGKGVLLSNLLDTSGFTDTVADGAQDYELSIDKKFERVILDERPAEKYPLTDDED